MSRRKLLTIIMAIAAVVISASAVAIFFINLNTQKTTDQPLPDGDAGKIQLDSLRVYDDAELQAKVDEFQAAIDNSKDSAEKYENTMLMVELLSRNNYRHLANSAFLIPLLETEMTDNQRYFVLEAILTNASELGQKSVVVTYATSILALPDNVLISPVDNSSTRPFWTKKLEENK
jgi:hypothetical protein